MNLTLERRAQITVAGACAHIAQENNADAAKLVNMFVTDVMEENGIKFDEALEMLARAGIAISMMAAEPDVEETFRRITLTLSELQ